MPVEIVEYSIEDLAQALKDDSLWQRSVYPISRHRALSHINNPRAEASDVVLIVGLENDEILGYIGIVPGCIFINEQPQRLGWLSTWWVDPKAGRNLGALLLLRAIFRYDKKIAISAFTDSAKAAYDATGRFVQLQNLQGATIHLRLELSRILLQRYPRASALESVFRLADKIINLSSELVHMLWERQHGRFVSKVKEISVIDEPTEAFIKQRQKHELCRRNKAELEWIKRYPWILEAPAKDYDEYKGRYDFSATAQRFETVSLTASEPNGEIIGFLMLQNRDGRLSLPFVCYDAENLDEITKIIAHHLIAMKAVSFTCFDLAIHDRLDALGLPYLFRRPASRLFYISTAFADVDFSAFHLQDGDGDGAFM